LALTVNLEQGLTDKRIQNEVLTFDGLEKNGYIQHVGQETIKFGTTKYWYEPTARLWGVADRREGDCFYWRTPIVKNLRVVRVEKHPVDQKISQVYLTYTREMRLFAKIYLAAQRLPLTPNVNRRMVLVEDPFTNKFNIVEDEITAGQ
jgi:hypothetical protein